MKVAWETLAAAILVGGSILFVGRYDISATPPGTGVYAGNESVYRLDRWTGKVVNLCYQTIDQNNSTWQCPESVPAVQSAK